MNLSYLLIKPSTQVKEQFQIILSQILDDINVFVYDEDDHDIGWLLSIAQQVEVIIIDVDNCDAITSQFITFLLAHPNSYYITNDDTIPYKLISKNRIYNLDWIIEKIKQDEDDTDVEEE
jgi:hypothetical protein